MLKKLSYLALFLMAVVVTGTYLAFNVPEQPEVASGAQVSQYSIRCVENAPAASIDKNGELSITVWNIYKQQRDSWHQALVGFSADSDLVLLQEAKLTQELGQYLQESRWQVTMANAFTFLDTPAGVMNLSRQKAEKTCAYLAVEPWLRLPKSALLSRYPLSDGSTLTVVNLHGINFAWGVDEYRAQFAALASQIGKAEGPVIVAGDFNTWREERMAVVEEFAEQLALSEVTMDKDLRIRIFGWPLDHLFYRGLRLEQAEAPVTDASDHHPIIARFRLLESKGAKQ
ncbi:endonuclease/exonuclease/phosphatase family protein [Photobacterium sp. SP02]|uniref:endonuclease/exonuclease/phosphatase family protein n=1 Tax=Photobacterium sp. SP02 TaxID=3032280 RepID=UPI003145404A